VLDRLLPAVDELPGAGALGLAETAQRDPLLDAAPGAIETVLGALPADFESLDAEGQDRALRRAQDRNEDAFAILISIAYNSYYVDARVLARLERLTGYEAGPPQPRGYEVEPFDASLLEPIKNREPFWRKVES
jgi:hypothetical protein